jgi:hypothetical protein
LTGAAATSPGMATGGVREGRRWRAGR